MPSPTDEQPYDLTVVDGAYTLTLSELGPQGIPGPAIATELEVAVRNQSGAPMTKGTIVYLSGSTGQRPLIVKAQANSDATSAQTIGFVKDTINNNADGVVIVSGLLENINTNGLGDGTQLYLDPATAGTWTTTKPSAPSHLVYVGIVVKAHNTQGVIYVSVQNGYELNELHDVAISSPSTGQVIRRNAGNTLWQNATLTNTDVGAAAAVHTHVSADITDATSAATPSTIVKRNATGGVFFASDGYSSPSITATRTGTAGIPVVSLSHNGTGPGVSAITFNGTALVAGSNTSTYHAEFGFGGDDRSFVARVKGAFGWFRGLFTGRIQAADTLTADRTYTLPDATGTIILDSTLGDGVNGLSTITGAKSFSGQVQLTGQAATDGDSAMTRGLGDARYGQSLASYLSSDGPAVNNSTVLVNTGLQLSLSVGLWLVDTTLFFRNNTNAAGGKAKVVIASGTATNARGTSNIANLNASRSATTGGLLVERSTTSAIAADGIFWATGILNVSSDCIVVVQYAQGVAQSTDSFAVTGSYLTATKIN